MRAAFTICLNGLHHLEHNNFAKSMSEMFDVWVIVEGASNNGGSTSWCKPAMDKYHSGGHSVDGTLEYLQELERRTSNTFVCTTNGVWASKDAMVNAALAKISDKTDSHPGYLWEVDSDEQWSLADIEAAEQGLSRAGGKTGMFHADFFVGPGLVARGAWGEGLWLPYNRLWAWNGVEMFRTHEPPVLEGGNDPSVLLPQRFKHYAYYFEKDVEFKDSWYGRHSGILKNWRRLQGMDGNHFPCPITELTPFAWGGNGGSNTVVERI